MYDLFLILHSWLRWAAILAGVGATVAAFRLRPGFPDSEQRADRRGLVLTIVLDLQLLIGLVLYLGLSPMTDGIFQDFGAAMAEPLLRFWAVEHITLMLVAIVVAHVGRVLARRASTPGSKRFRLLVAFAIATLAMIAATPWPGMTAGRPLFRI